MSDKSFGDHMSRGMVKNPLLSTAVTGLSIEDLTQNAVLLPVSRSQEPFGRQETETPAQFTPTPSGDTFTPIHPPDPPQPKDDFDVNEYFARLQGTRYVSAPLNSHIEDANANIEREENLEEINLNEPTEDIQQQSITADIAQNFSQLPAVLPQVASAVFSSFSNMLSMKRETPERVQALQGAGETQAGVTEMGVPLVGVSERAPPLREPPTSGPGNFRLTTKKKYAQIPGLSSGEPAQMPTYTPPTFNQPIFTPPQPEIKDNIIKTESIPTLDVGQSNVDFNAFSNIQNIPESRNISNILEAPKQEANSVATSQFAQDSNTQAAIIPPPPMFSNLGKRDSLPNVGKTILPPSVARRIGSNKPTISQQTPAYTPIGNIFVPAQNAEELPQNMSQTLNQSNSFPSSYAQEAAQFLIPMSTPIPSTSTVSSTVVSPNVFLTTAMASGGSQQQRQGATPQIDLSMTVSAPNATGISPYSIENLPPQPKNTVSTTPATLSHVSSIPGNLPPPPRNAFNTSPAMNSQTESLIMGNLPPPPKNIFAAQPDMESNTSASSVISSGQSAPVLASPLLFTPGSHSQILAPPPPNIPPPTNIPLFSNTAPGTSSSTSDIFPQPQMSSPNLQNRPNTDFPAQSTVTSQAIPQIFNPNQHVSPLSKDITHDQIEQRIRPTVEPAKIPEPPKASGNTNFRMTKKRPQYYSGPIEGVGAISNNVKPTLTPVATTAFQGAVFTPETNTGYQAAVFTPENITGNITSSQEAISVPTNINEQQQQFYNYTPVDVNQPSSSINCTSSESETSIYNYNTTFDLSRQAPDACEPPKQESAFGIIGSLKSKLSSIDINKLQNSVTTFFDPGYNVLKPETAENTQPAYGPNQGFEIFVANPDTQAQPYNYNAHQNNFTYGQGSIPNASDYYNQQVHNVYSTNSYYSQPIYGTQSYSQSQIPVQQDDIQNTYNQISAEHTRIPKDVNLRDSYDSGTDYHKDNVVADNTITYKPTPAVNTESSERATAWNAYDPASECVDNSSAAGNITLIPTSRVDTDSTQRNNIRSMYDLSSASDKHNVADNSNISHEQTSYVEHDSSQRTNVWCTYGSPSTSYGPHNVGQNSNNTQKPSVDTESEQNANILGTYDLTSPSDDKDNVAEHLTTNEGAFIQAPLESNVPKMGEMPIVKNVADALKNLQIEEDEKAKIEEIGLVEEENLPSYNSSQPTFPYISDLSTPYLDENGEKKKSAIFNYVDILQNPDIPEVPKAYTAPLQNPLIKRQEIFDGVSEGGHSWNSNEEEVDDQSVAERLLSLADEGSEDENFSTYESEPAENLDICETCREVNQPDDEDEDLTHKLIKNITAPIQLSNPVEVPLTETDVSRNTPDEFVNQCAEILLIADETIETLQIQSATELLNETETTNVDSGYGWRAEAPLPPGEDIMDHDYTFKANPNAIGFFANNDLFFDNIANYDNKKTELNVSKETPIVFQSQMSIPSAPPAEDSDDAKSDETGVLDVQSIEQDASKDFPVLEEYVIEPETEDDKVELKKDEVKDTFTNRVDRFKQLEGSDDATEQKESSSLAISNTKMSSYFDTGNYAVETHFKKSLTSPTIARIPPGFEDHYELMPNNGDKQYEIIKVPDTTTQTRVTTVVSNVLTKNENLTSTVFSNMSPFTIEPTHIQEPQSETKLPDFTSVFGAKIAFTDAVATGTKKTIEPPNEQAPVNPKFNVKDKVQENNTVTLPDPINFFGSSTQEPASAEGVNRLASYFAAPAKPENTKSFFELSQGQDHYRQSEEVQCTKSFFELSQSQDHYKENIANIPHDKYVAHVNLMKDLTSSQNIEPNKEQIVRTVNYFTLNYANDVLNFNKGEPSLNLIKESLNTEPTKSNNVIENNTLEKEETISEEMFTDILNKCNYCNALKAESVLIRETLDVKETRFRQAMDGGSNTKNGEVDMMPGRETERSVNVRMEDVASEGDNGEGVAMVTENRSSSEYEPVKHHWFYRVDCEDKSMWRGFSLTDSRAIENAFHSSTLNESTLVPTDGGRYDVNVMGRLRIAVYWTDKPTNVRRCSWFYKGTTDSRYVPYTEAVAEKLEVEYRHGITTGEWHRRLVLPNNELVVMHGPAVMVHFLQAGTTDAFSAPNQTTMRPRVVRRGIDESEIEDTEPSSIDHLLLLCHGVGSACDMRFRPVEEVVDDFRATSLQLLQSHYRNSCDNGIVGRVEVLPISWHASLHSGPRGVDRRLARVTLASIPRLRNFTNDTVLDVLFYTSPHYCQMILDTVCGELNRIYTLFMSRNPDFKGRVSLGGHSLGSVILYDLLCNQPIPRNPVKTRGEKTYISGTAANNPTMQYPTLCFEPLTLYALGSPIAIFECIRGVEMLGGEFYLPTCRNFFNIFHPYDPIAYRIEPLVNSQLQDVKPSLIPHHKGRKRMHLELKDTMARVGADLKQKLVESIKSTWSSMWSSAAPPDHQLEKVVEEEIEKEQLEGEDSCKEEPAQADVTPGEMLGRLNNGRRVDYVLQEAPFEMINEYIFAMSSHVCYWESEDVMLLMLREIYDSMGVQPDVTVPQQSMTVHRTTIVTNGERIVTTDASTSRIA